MDGGESVISTHSNNLMSARRLTESSLFYLFNSNFQMTVIMFFWQVQCLTPILNSSASSTTSKMKPIIIKLQVFDYSLQVLRFATMKFQK